MHIRLEITLRMPSAFNLNKFPELKYHETCTLRLGGNFNKNIIEAVIANLILKRFMIIRERSSS